MVVSTKKTATPPKSTRKTATPKKTTSAPKSKAACLLSTDTL